MRTLTNIPHKFDLKGLRVDDDIVDWRGYRELLIAIQKADIALDIWAGMNLKKIKEETEAYLRGMEGKLWEAK